MRKAYIIAFFGLVWCVFWAAGDAFAARSGGTFTFCAPYGGDLFSLDMHRSGRTQDYLVGMNIHRGLYKWDAEQNKPVLDLAESVDISPDGLTYTFHLRDDVVFHNGRGLTADDVIWSFERIMTPGTKSPCARYVRAIKGAGAVEKGEAEKISGLRNVDDFTLEVQLENAVDLSYPLFRPCTSVLPKEEVEKKKEGFGSDPVGCGPFRFIKWVKGSEVVLEKFEDFYEEGRPYLDKVVFKIMPEGAARDLAFRAKELDATIVGSTQYPVYKKDEEISQNMIEVAEMYTRHVGFNLDFEPFSNPLVRQAINYAIDAPLIVEKLLKNKAYPAVGFLPTTSPAFNPKAEGYAYNPEKAKTLMKKAGYEDGFTFECIGTSNEAWGITVVEALIPFLSQINVTVKPQLLEGAALADRNYGGDFQAYIWSVDSGPDPWQALRRWHSDNPASGGNFVGYSNGEFDRLLDEAAKERDPAKRIELLQRADAVFLEDAPLWFFNYNKAVLAHQPWVHGLKPVAVEMMYQDLSEVWVEASSPRATEK